MAQISVEIICLPGSLLRGNLHREYHLRDVDALDAEMKRQLG